MCVCATAVLTGPDVSVLVRSLRRLSSHPGAALAHLNVCVLPHAQLMETLLDAAPGLSHLQVEVQTVLQGLGSPAPPRAAESDADAAGERSARTNQG